MKYLWMRSPRFYCSVHRHFIYQLQYTENNHMGHWWVTKECSYCIHHMQCLVTMYRFRMIRPPVQFRCCS